ncbi:unnamed protein product [Cylicostephanus goldi]|uniref:Uncharacterized protein n=1 Tax=Cylicostephanus goldi TaxID=71465 RepID=A0A3P6RSF7_CYLGO|nr:unnamed protein product [Cylicostephanus goldi]
MSGIVKQLASRKKLLKKARDNLVTETSTAAAVDESFEREELDYEEDDDEEHKEERTGRFTSERKPADATPPTSTNNIDKVEGRRQSGGDNRNHNNNQKQWRNGSGRGNGRGRGNNGHRYRGGPNMQYGGPMRMQQGPGMVNGPTPLLSLNTQGLYPPSGGKILINPNFRGPMGPPGPGPLGPAGVLPLVGAPSVLPTIVPGQGPIIPRLPNGIPLTGKIYIVMFGCGVYDST